MVAECLNKAIDLLRQHEGISLKPYRDTEGILTIGYGRNLEHVGISGAEAESMLYSDAHDAMQDLHRFPWWPDLSIDAAAALIDMRFNLGPGGFRKFKQMLHALGEGDMESAAKEILDSKYATQVGQRAKTIAGMVSGG